MILFTEMWLLKTKPQVERILVNDALFSKVAEMRYKIYCEEMGFLEKKKYSDDKETDEYDGSSVHVVVKVGNRLGGYARVILPNGKGLPIFSHFDIPEEKDMAHSCEVSRLMISKYYRRKTETRREIFSLLVTEIQKIAGENDIHSVYAVVEDWLLESLNKRGYSFGVIGESTTIFNTVNYPVILKI